MHIITFVTQKGGVGKTTLTVNCAVAAEKKKKKVLILDLDPQGSAEGWYQDREAETPRSTGPPGIVDVAGRDRQSEERQFRLRHD